MREQEFHARDKKVRKMTKDGLVEENRTRGTTERISKREADEAFPKDKEEMLAQELAEKEAAGAETKAGTGVSMRDAGDKPVRGKSPQIKPDESVKPVRRQEGRTRRGREDTFPVRKRETGALPGKETLPEREALPEGKRLSDGEGGGRTEDGRKILKEHMRSRTRDRTTPAKEVVRETDRQTGETKKPASGRLRYTREELEREGLTPKGTAEKGGAGNVWEKDGVQSRADRVKPTRKEKKPEKAKQETGTDPRAPAGSEKRSRLRFERWEQPPKGENILPASKTTAGTLLSTAVRVETHRQIREAEDDNSGLEAAHKLERAGETGTVWAGARRRRLNEKPYRGRIREVRLQVNRNEKRDFSKLLSDQPDLKKKPVSRWMQKQKIKRKYAAAAREAKKGAAQGAYVLTKKGQVVRAAAQAVSKKTVLGTVGIAALLVSLAGVLLTSCTSMLSGVQSAFISTCYTADEDAINRSDLHYGEMETDLEISISSTEEDFPDYDEYLYNVGEISHNPYELLGYLSAVYGDFTYAQMETELERIFAEQYQLVRQETVETRTRINEDGEEETYEWRILKTTLTVRPLSEIIAQDLQPGEQTDLYEVYMQTCGNRQCFASPFDLPWIARVTSPYGYRVHPITGGKDLHRGIDIAVPEGTPIKAAQDGRVVSAGYRGDYGLCVVIEDGKGYQSKYAHCSGIAVSAGQEVMRGDVIAAAGSTGSSTGAHLHLEVLHDGRYLNPYFFVDSGTDGYQPDGMAAGQPAFSDHPGAAMGDGSFAAMLAEAEKYLRNPYVWGGSSPPNFDCSGFVSWVVDQSGVGNVGRQTAQGLYNLCTPIPKESLRPGDLVFFTGTYSSANPVTHVGIYTGSGRMIHAGDPISYTSIESRYWTGHFYSGGRLP